MSSGAIEVTANTLGYLKNHENDRKKGVSTMNWFKSAMNIYFIASTEKQFPLI